MIVELPSLDAMYPKKTKKTNGFAWLRWVQATLFLGIFFGQIFCEQLLTSEFSNERSLGWVGGHQSWGTEHMGKRAGGKMGYK